MFPRSAGCTVLLKNTIKSSVVYVSIAKLSLFNAIALTKQSEEDGAIKFRLTA